METIEMSIYSKIDKLIYGVITNCTLYCNDIAMTTYNINRSHKHKVKSKKIDNNENTQYDYIHKNAKTWKTKLCF